MESISLAEPIVTIENIGDDSEYDPQQASNHSAAEVKREDASEQPRPGVCSFCADIKRELGHSGEACSHVEYETLSEKEVKMEIQDEETREVRDGETAPRPASGIVAEPPTGPQTWRDTVTPPGVPDSGVETCVREGQGGKVVTAVKRKAACPPPHNAKVPKTHKLPVEYIFAQPNDSTNSGRTTGDVSQHSDTSVAGVAGQDQHVAKDSDSIRLAAEHGQLVTSGISAAEKPPRRREVELVTSGIMSAAEKTTRPREVKVIYVKKGRPSPVGVSQGRAVPLLVRSHPSPGVTGHGHSLHSHPSAIVTGHSQVVSLRTQSRPAKTPGSGNPQSSSDKTQSFPSDAQSSSGHPQSISDHRQSSSVHPQSSSDHPQSNSDYPQSCSGHPQSCSGHPQSISDHPQSCSGHPQSCSGHLKSLSGNPQSNSGHPQSCSGHPQSCSGHPQSCSGHPQSCSGHPQSCSGLPQSCSGHPQSCSGLLQSCSGHQQSCSGHQQSCSGHPQSSSGHLKSCSGHPQSCSGHLQSCSGQSQSCSGHLKSCSGHPQSCSGHQQSCSGHPQSCSGHQQSCSGHPQSCSGHPQSCSSHQQSCSSHQQSCSGHPQSCSGHQQSCSGHPQSCSGHPQSCSGHLQSCSGHPQSCSSHPQSSSGHPQSCSNHLQLCSGHPQSRSGHTQSRSGKARSNSDKAQMNSSLAGYDESEMEVAATSFPAERRQRNEITRFVDEAGGDGTVTHYDNDDTLLASSEDDGNDDERRGDRPSLPSHSASALRGVDAPPPQPADHSFDEDMARQVLSALNKLAASVNNVEQMLHLAVVRIGALEDQTGRRADICLPEHLRLPLETPEDVAAFEQELRGEDFRKKTLAYLSAVGGDNISKACKRIMSKIFTTTLAMMFNMNGGGSQKKLPFRPLLLKMLVFEAVKNVFPDTTEGEVEKAVTMWLVSARDRDGGRTKRARADEAD